MKEKIMGTKRWFYYVSIGLVLIVVYKFLDNFTGIGMWLGKLLGILAPFLLAILFAYILYTPCKKIENFIKSKTKIKQARGISILIVYIIAAIIVYFILKFILPAMFNSIIDLVNNAQNYYNGVKNLEIGDDTLTPFIKDNILKPIVEFITKINFQEMFTTEKIISYISSVMGVVKFIINVFISIVCSIYILAERESIVSFLDRLSKAVLSKRSYDYVQKYFNSGNLIFFKFISSQLLDAFVVAIIMSIALTIMKVKYGIALGVMIGLFNLIPYFGAIIAVIVAALITLLTGGWEQAIIMVIVTVILQQIDANIINPRITSNKLDVSPLLVIFAVTVGGAYFGVLGMFLGVPIVVLIKAVIEDYIKSKQKIEDTPQKETIK